MSRYTRSKQAVLEAMSPPMAPYAIPNWQKIRQQGGLSFKFKEKLITKTSFTFFTLSFYHIPKKYKKIIEK